MKKITKILFLLFAPIIVSSLAFAEQDSSSSGSPNKKEIETIVHDYIVKNPQVLIEAVQNLQKEQTSKEVVKIKQNAAKFREDLFSADMPGRSSVGNPNGKIIMTVFYSYQCPNCRMMESIIDDIIHTNPQMQVIYVPWPFENAEDVYAAKVALAAQKQGKFFDVHKALMNAPDMLTKDQIDAITKSVPGLDTSKVQKDADDKTIENGLKDNFKLAEEMGFTGTPVFVLTDRTMKKFAVIPGRTSAAEVKKAINEVK
jgi:protein-disulfide isomerase